MIAIISSTLVPPAATSVTKYRNFISNDQRLKQTEATINSLKEFTNIYVFDNSYPSISEREKDILKPARLWSIDVFPYQNKGLSEIYLLLLGIRNLPDNVPIFKISGRYILTEQWDFKNLRDFDFVGKFDGPKTISTRAYYFRNKNILHEVLICALNFMYAYSSRIVGPRSFIRILKNAINLSHKDNIFCPTISIERAMGEAIHMLSLNTQNLKKLYIAGISGNPDDKLKRINE